MEIISIIGLTLIIIYMLFMLFRAPKDFNPITEQPLTLIFAVIIIAIVASFNKYLGLLLFLALILTGFIVHKKDEKKESFDIVEDNVDKVVEFEDDSLLSSLRNDEDLVTGVWGGSYLGKTMGLNRA